MKGSLMIFKNYVAEKFLSVFSFCIGKKWKKQNLSYSDGKFLQVKNFSAFADYKVSAKSGNFLKSLILNSLLKSVFVYQTNCFLEKYSGL